MKIKQILPLAGMTGIAAVAAPLVTSCNQKGTELIWRSGEDLPALPNPSETSFATAEEATNAYFNDISNDKTLLSKDMLCGMVNSAYATTASKMTARTDAIDQTNHLVSVHTTISGKHDYLGKYTYTFDIKNVEFVVVKSSDGTIYLEPKIMHEVLDARSKYNPGTVTEEFVKAVQVIMDHTSKLSSDKSWSLYYESVLPGNVLTQTIDYKNVYEYAYQVVYDYNISLIDFSIATEYFKTIQIG